MIDGRSLLDLTEVFLESVDRVPDAGFVESSGLPGWSKAHVIAHVHFNAIALGHLVEWARTGVETPMYSSPGQRNDDIERGAAEPPNRLRLLVSESATALAADYGRLTPRELDHLIVTAQGRTLPARDISWLRCRELGVHAVDLGAAFDDLPGEFLTRLVEEIVAKRLEGGEAAVLAAYLTGRASAGETLGPWL